MRLKKIQKNTGSLLLEAGLALALFALSMSALFSMIYYQQNTISIIPRHIQVLFQAYSNLEITKQNIQNTFLYKNNTLQNLTLFNYQNASNTLNIITHDYMTPCLNKTSSIVSLLSPENQNIIQSSEELRMYIFDSNGKNNLSNDCGGKYTELSTSSIISSLQQYSTFYNSHFQNTNQKIQQFIFPDATSTQAFDVLNNLITVAYTTNSGTSTLALLTNTNNNFNLGCSLELPYQVNNLDSITNAAFLAFDSNSNQVGFVDTSNSSSPKIIQTVSLPGVAGSYPGAESIGYFNKKIYVGTHRTAGREFHIFNQDNNSLTWLGSLELNHNINDLCLAEPFILSPPDQATATSRMNPYAFSATSGNTKDIIVLDTATSSNSTQINSVAFSGNEDATTILCSGTDIYIGRKNPLTQNDHNIYKLSLSNPYLLAPTASTSIPGDVASIKKYGDYIFITSYTSTSSLISLLDANSLQALLPSITLESYTTQIARYKPKIDMENNALFILLHDRIIRLDLQN
jgi:hypothetical protein